MYVHTYRFVEEDIHMEREIDMYRGFYSTALRLCTYRERAVLPGKCLESPRLLLRLKKFFA